VKKIPARTKHQKSGGFANKSIGQIRSLAKTAVATRLIICKALMNHDGGTVSD
jgi:hypothetical protein